MRRTGAVEHLIAASGWRPAGGGRASFVHRFGPRLTEDEARAFLGGLVSTVTARGLRQLRTENAFPEEHPAAIPLRRHGFRQTLAQERFRIPAREMRGRIGRSAAFARRERAWKLDFVPLDAVSPSILGRFLHSYSLPVPARSPDLLHWSFVILAEGGIVAVCIVERTARDTMAFRTRVVSKAFPGGRRIGNLMLLDRILQELPEGSGIDYCTFEARPGEHQETANLATRAGGERLPPAMLWTYDLKAS